MRGLGKFKLVGVAAVLGALLAVTGGLIVSLAAGGSSIQAKVYDDAVRFTIQNDRVEILRAEVFDLGGKRLFDSGPVMGNALDWNTSTESGERVAHGVYLYVITAWDSQGMKSQVGKRMTSQELSYM
jgi:hypothetical protein